MLLAVAPSRTLRLRFFGFCALSRVEFCPSLIFCLVLCNGLSRVSSVFGRTLNTVRVCRHSCYQYSRRAISESSLIRQSLFTTELYCTSVSVWSTVRRCYTFHQDAVSMASTRSRYKYTELAGRHPINLSSVRRGLSQLVITVIHRGYNCHTYPWA